MSGWYHYCNTYNYSLWFHSFLFSPYSSWTSLEVSKNAKTNAGWAEGSWESSESGVLVYLTLIYFYFLAVFHLPTTVSKNSSSLPAFQIMDVRNSSHSLQTTFLLLFCQGLHMLPLRDSLLHSRSVVFLLKISLAPLRLTRSSALRWKPFVLLNSWRVQHMF